MQTQEHIRLNQPVVNHVQPWRQWGAYVSERQWGTVREDYSQDGNAWKYITHDMARSKTYRWGEDGIASFCDLYQLLIFNPSFWNGKDPILKERLFGLDPFEGNHGEDVKECYYYLDALPTHSYMKYLYKYPQDGYPYDLLVSENKKRTTYDREYEITDTPAFDNGKYFDIFIEYAKASPEDVVIKIEAFNRATTKATLHFVPQLFFRNTWQWDKNVTTMPQIISGPKSTSFISLKAECTSTQTPHGLPFKYILPTMYLYTTSNASMLFTNNESNSERLYGQDAKNISPYVKDAFHRKICEKIDCTNPQLNGTKACFHFDSIEIEPKSSYCVYLRLSKDVLQDPLKDCEQIIAMRKKEADEFYTQIHPKNASKDDRLIQRQAISGMIWGQQFYFYNVKRWLEGDNPAYPPPPSRYKIRNQHWTHFSAKDILSMPDTWEYPWFASWDLAFHCLVLSLADMEMAKFQFNKVLTHLFQSPNGQIPAYEWRFSDLNPPVQPWALWKLYEIDQKKDREFLEFSFLKLLSNFTWWVNKVDRLNNNFFEGGFLGLDNISIIDRSKPLPGGGTIEQSDGTGWMGFFSLMMMRIALELSKEEKNYEKIAAVFLEQFIYIAYAIQKATQDRDVSTWNEQDAFFYDVIMWPNQSQEVLKIRSLVGLIPFFSIDFFDEEELKQYPLFHEMFKTFTNEYPIESNSCISKISQNGKTRYLFAFIPLEQIKRFLSYSWSKDEFKSSFGLRSLSKYHEAHPYTFGSDIVRYEPGESTERIKGGNSNWRGPVWMPTSYLFIEALMKLHRGVGDLFIINAPGEQDTTLENMAKTYAQNLMKLFRKSPQGTRPIHGDTLFYQNDPNFSDLILFYEHFHAETGRGLGASHQTGWSGLIANLINDWI